MTEREVLKVIDSVIDDLCYKFMFGYHDLDDMRQQARMAAIKSLDKYDENQPLPNFIYSCVHNALFNFKRNNFQRPDKPCLKCPLNAYDPDNLKSLSSCTAFEDKMECELYSKWYKKNEIRYNIMKPIGITEVDDVNEDSMMRVDNTCDKMSKTEILAVIDQHLPVALRKEYTKMKAGIKINKKIERDIMVAVRQIVVEHNLEL